MEPNTPQDSVALALQIQTLTASMEELTRQNQEMRLWLSKRRTGLGLIEMTMETIKEGMNTDDLPPYKNQARTSLGK